MNDPDGAAEVINEGNLMQQKEEKKLLLRANKKKNEKQSLENLSI